MTLVKGMLALYFFAWFIPTRLASFEWKKVESFGECLDFLCVSILVQQFGIYNSTSLQTAKYTQRKFLLPCYPTTTAYATALYGPLCKETCKFLIRPAPSYFTEFIRLIGHALPSFQGKLHD